MSRKSAISNPFLRCSSVATSSKCSLIMTLLHTAESIGILAFHASNAPKSGHNITERFFNYGQGSSREHAALAPLYLGVKAIICKSFARIHRQNLINNGILPLEFVNEADYDRIDQGDDLVIANIRNIVENGGKIIVEDKTKGFSFEVKCELSERGKGMMLAGGLLNFTKNGK